MTPQEHYDQFSQGARILALQRMVVGLLADKLGCSLELADARFQEEWDRCFEVLMDSIPSHQSALTAELRRLHHEDRTRWLQGPE